MCGITTSALLPSRAIYIESGSGEGRALVMARAQRGPARQWRALGKAPLSGAISATTTSATRRLNPRERVQPLHERGPPEVGRTRRGNRWLRAALVRGPGAPSAPVTCALGRPL